MPTHFRFALLLLAVTGLTLVTAQRVSAQIAPESACADCHFARPDAPRRDHLEAWDRSPHGRSHVGCEKCHGGNPKVFESLPAHAEILSALNAKSPVNPRNLPATCGGCHTGPFVAFQDSQHYALLQAASGKGPTCSTCHGAVDGRVLSPKALASQCSGCHGPGEEAPREQRARMARQEYEGLTVVREQMKLAQTLIKRIEEPERRAALTEMLQQAQVPLTRAVDAGHKFTYDDLHENLTSAQVRIEALMKALANR